MTTVTILGASGGVGLELTRQAIARDYDVVALCRHPERIEVADPRLTRVAVDVLDRDAISSALDGRGIVLSALGTAEGEKPGVLSAGAGAITAAAPERIVSIGALGTGGSAAVAGFVTRNLLGLLMRAELPDKVGADSAILAAGGTVMHAGPLTKGPVSPTRRTVPLDQTPWRLFPAAVSRATVAAAMLDAVQDGPRGQIMVPLPR
ncbi:NAD(P)-dependent oxidoreductase [Nocardia alni]|uniref:NAD(P)-dependent oxidoreductase n=1 Tax=Nocardia alni TaxID=2815723 RepID=UPI0027DEF64E|nr:SDR family oxidoreductase [Nocardia alni]